MTMTRKTTVNPTLLIIIIEIMTTGDDAAETRMNPIILWAAIPGTMACHAMEDAMAIQETTGQMVGDSRAFSVPRRRHRPQRGQFCQVPSCNVEQQVRRFYCYPSGATLTFTLHVFLYYNT